MNRVLHAPLLSLLAFAAFAACSSGGDDATAGVQNGGNFVVLKTEPLNNGRLFLNDPIRIDFSNPVDLGSANLDSVSFQVLDQNGTALAEQPAGRFELDRSPGDTEVGRRLLFIPRFPTNDTYDDGGFRPGRFYLVQLVGGDRHNGTALRDRNGKGLAQPISFQFATADGTTPAQLFRNRAAGGPRRVTFDILPATPGEGVPLNKLGSPPVELRLTFDQPLNPNSANLPTRVDPNPLQRSINDRGRLFLEYDDPVLGANTWIPAVVDLELNDLERSIVVARPIGVLPNKAVIRVIVENTLEDISGESNVANAAYNRVFGIVQTRDAYEPQFDAIVEDFRDTSAIDLEAAFLEPQAQVGNGFLKAGFSFEGTRTELVYEPNVTEVVLNTNFTQIVPRNGPPFNVSGGVFNFKSVLIPQGVRVFGQGTNPMVWLVNEDFTVRGELSVRGGNGQRVDTLNSANFPSAGGVGTCSGGNGGAGSPNGTSRDMQGQTGFGPLQVPGGGGRGGRIACTAGCGRGSGGGGGSLATQGDPWFKVLAGAGTSFQQQRGVGGQGCAGTSGAASRSLQGGEAGPVSFTDARTDNNFWGAAVNVNRRLRIVGELTSPRGGGGGGGGGDLSNAGGCNPNEVNFISDSKGGGGGGGGGVLVVKALGTITVEATGRIIADGGHGGGGEQAGSCNEGGGGGGGSGGMVILMAGKQIRINAKGIPTPQRYRYGLDNDYDFSISADGGVCLTGTFGSPSITGKYPASGTAVAAGFGTSYDNAPYGAFGGMGVVQLMAPPGDPDPTNTQGHNADGTNTVLDDNIVVIRNGVEVRQADKTSLLAWRGFPNTSGVLVDDFGNPTNINANEGDIRPAPAFLPVPFSSQTRARSKWIDTGFSKRRPLLAPDNQPRGIVEQGNFLAGPTYEFAAVRNAPGTPANGYVDYVEAGGDVVAINYPSIGSPVNILRMDSGASFLGMPAYRVELTDPALGNVADRYAQYECELRNAQNTTLASFRILSHTDRSLLLDATTGLLPAGATRVQVRAKFFKIVTNGSEGLGPTYSSNSQPVPVANVRIGFAFHTNPASAAGTRFPADPNRWVYDLSDPATQETIRQLGASYVMWDVLFNTTFRTTAPPIVEPGLPAFSPSSPRPELHFLRLPFRF